MTDRTEITEACKGLLYPSESDRPLEVVECVEEDRDNFFDDLPNEFQALHRAVQTRLKDVRIFRLGDGPEVTIYVIGKCKDDDTMLAIKTVAVET